MQSYYNMRDIDTMVHWPADENTEPLHHDAADITHQQDDSQSLDDSPGSHEVTICQELEADGTPSVQDLRRFCQHPSLKLTGVDRYD